MVPSAILIHIELILREVNKKGTYGYGYGSLMVMMLIVVMVMIPYDYKVNAYGYN